ncbi:hypothetical protein FACS1894216_06200 [Synergistales bacterium]|nr:hypothetical protein FACS1894216_06200 [Synergistales bacterium]
MTLQENLRKLEDLFALDSGALAPEMALDDVEQYDSMTKLLLVVLMDDEFGKKLTGEQVKAFKTVRDILDFMAAPDGKSG